METGFWERMVYATVIVFAFWQTVIIPKVDGWLRLGECKMNCIPLQMEERSIVIVMPTSAIRLQSQKESTGYILCYVLDLWIKFCVE
ncbi:hypothetical protein TNIN_176071 [Trichonephila inaurata madagascariensis]|uniref:Uncharacterized protein n=1 Tax=Trichonephila inaurata madagascariensis TaxID=2747483 RepID=A0A8X6XYV1_9ARAC|nr:hypothetical protein TNIN_176071 [Trichonephila inaurata madagascariensis]